MAVVRRNLTTLLDDLTRNPDREAFILRTPYRAFRWSRDEVRQAALALAGRLKRQGTGAGDRVMIQGPDSPEWCVAFLGVVAAGGVPVPVDLGCDPQFTRRVARRVAARVACAPRGSPAIADAVERIEPFEALREGWDSPLREPHRADADDTAEIVFTSGTTGEPRGVVLSHANLLAAISRIEHGFRKREWYLAPLLPMRFLSLVPLSHLFGQSLGLMLPIVMRSTAVFSASLQPRRIVHAIRADRPLAVITAPRTLRSLRDAVRREVERRGRGERLERALTWSRGRRWWRRAFATRDVRGVLGWRVWALVVGGAAIEPELESFWSDAGYALIQGYGMTEAAPIVAVHNPLDGRRHTLGRPVGGVEVQVADDGELLVRGPNVMQGYLDDDDGTEQVVRGGWLHTGDLVERDEQGRLYFKGRKKDVIVVESGMNVHPADVEAALEQLTGIRAALAFGVRGVQGESVHAAILTATPVAPGEIERYRVAANERLQRHQRIRRLSLWPDPEFPLTSTGKIRRMEVAQRCAHGIPDAPSPSSAVGRVSRELDAMDASLAAPLHAGARLSTELGLESLDMVELVSRLEERYRVSLDDAHIAPDLTVGELERIVAGEGQPQLRLPMPRWSRRWPVRMGRAISGALFTRPLFRLFVRLEVLGRERLDGLAGSPALIVANHTSMFDVPAVRAALPTVPSRRLAPAMAIETLPAHFSTGPAPAGRRLRSAVLYFAAVALFNAYPLPQSRGFRPSLEYTGELLDDGQYPLVFPEGRMRADGAIHEFKTGIGLLALQCRVPVVPVFLEGLARLLPPRGRWPRHGRARVSFGRPFDPCADTPADPRAVASRIERAVRDVARMAGNDGGKPR